MDYSKESLRKQIAQYREKINSVPEKHKGYWKRQLNNTKKLLYGHI